jgi:hypothetical protein
MIKLTKESRAIIGLENFSELYEIIYQKYK